MGDKTTTGSTVIGLVNGLGNSVKTSGTYMNATSDRIIFTTVNPNDCLTSITGSDIAFCIGNGNFYIGDKTRGIGGSEWTLLSTD